MEARQLLTTFIVTNTADSGNGSLRSAMLMANATPGANSIDFAIPASTAVNLGVPVPGFDPRTQTWKITLASALPAITNPVIIDGLSQADGGVAYRYPAQLATNPLGDPVVITSHPSTMAAKAGNDATPRLIIDGSNTGGSTGFVINASNSIVRGLVIDAFGVGISVPNPGTVGDLIQGNDIGRYFQFFVDPQTGSPLTAGGLGFGGVGNSLQGVLLGTTNATVGGVEVQDANVIVGNGLQGVSILPGAVGNQVIGNQIGIDGPTTGSQFAISPNGSDGVLIASSNNSVGGPASGAGNLISGNGGDGVHIEGATSIRNNIQGNNIGVGPAGNYRFGTGNPGNAGDGVLIQDASDTQVGGIATTDQNVISANGGAGVRIFGLTAIRNVVQNNEIGTTSDGISALGNHQEGVAVYSSNNVIGPKNVISANLRGVILSGLGATNNLVIGNFIGTDGTGVADLGNAQEGVRIDGGSDNQVIGNAQGSQVISGNNVGVLILGGTATRNLLAGNFIGTDATGKLDLGNSLEGLRIENAPGNTIGGSTAAARDVISANQWGAVLTGGLTTGNLIQGSNLGTDISGTLSLSNALDGVLVENSASGNLVGGPVGTANNIGFNRQDGVRIQDDSHANSILSNQIFANLGFGINLFAPGGYPTPSSGPNLGQPAPTLTSVATSAGVTEVQGQVTGTANTIYLVQFFANSPLDPTGANEGGQYLGQTTVTTDGSGSKQFSTDLATMVASNQFVTATATSLSGNTSEFSTPLPEAFGAVQFSMNFYQVNEDVGTASIVVIRVGGSGGAFTVNYTTSDNTAVAGTDYTTTTGTLSFGIGQLTQTINVPILDNGLPAPDKVLDLTLSNPTGSAILGSVTTAVLTIVGNKSGNEGTVEFQMGSQSVNQNAGSATIVVTRTGGNGQPITVGYATIDGTAQAGTDYTATSGTLSFGTGQTTAIITVPILNSGLSASDKTFGLTLNSPSGTAVLGPLNNDVVTIIGNKAGAFQFTSFDYFVGEAAGAAFLTVSRNLTDTAATVSYSTYDSSAKAGVDYRPTVGTLTFAPGQATATFTVPILINPRISGNLALNLVLFAPTGGATLAQPSSAVLVIINDFVDRMGPHVTSVSATSGRLGVAQVAVMFDEPVDPARVVNLLNYGYSIRIAGHDGRLGTRDDQLIGLHAASYNPMTRTVTLPLALAIPKNMPLEIMINEGTDVPGAGVGVSDLSGNLLDGNSDGLPGGPFTARLIARQAPSSPRVVTPKKGHAVKTKVTAKAIHGPTPVRATHSTRSHP